VGLAVIWGSTFVVIKEALTGISPMLFIAARFLLAAIILLPLYGRRMKRSAVPGGLLVGGLLFVAFALQIRFPDRLIDSAGTFRQLARL